MAALDLGFSRIGHTEGLCLIHTSILGEGGIPWFSTLGEGDVEEDVDGCGSVDHGVAGRLRHQWRLFRRWFQQRVKRWALPLTSSGNYGGLSAVGGWHSTPGARKTPRHTPRRNPRPAVPHRLPAVIKIEKTNHESRNQPSPSRAVVSIPRGCRHCHDRSRRAFLRDS
jgi:hypothetical protein